VTRHRLALWVLLAGKVLGAWGLTWDIQWHLLIGRDTFWIPPHLMMYGGVTAGLLVAFAVLALDTAAAHRGRPPRGSSRGSLPPARSVTSGPSRSPRR
jgi:hypothetical protein